MFYGRENAVETFLSEILKKEAKIREGLSNPNTIVMMAEDWEKHKNATECHICDKRLWRDSFLDSIPICDHDTGLHCGQSHKSCYYSEMKKMGFIGPKIQRKERDNIDQWVENNQETCLFCAEPLLRQNFRLCERLLSCDR